MNPSPPGRRTLLKGLAVSSLIGLRTGDAVGQAGAPRRGGILTMHLTREPTNLDPIAQTTNPVLYAAGACYSALLMYDPLDPAKIVGDLATDWTISPDGKVYTFHLRRNVRFHDGKPLTAEDVRYTFDYVRDPPKGQISPRNSLLEIVDRVETPDPYTVRFTLTRASASFLSTLASGWMLVYPKHVLSMPGALATQMIGSGPFRFKGYQKGVAIDLERNDDYFIPGRPYLDGVKIFVVPDPATALAHFRAGRILAYLNMDNEEAHLAGKYGKDFVVMGVPALSFMCVSFNTRQKPWDDLRVRQAASLALDREEAIQILAQGDAVVGGLMPPGLYGLSSEQLAGLPGYTGRREDNLAKARALLAQAGLANGFSTVLMTKRSRSYESLSVLVKDQLGRIGIQSTISLQDDAQSADSLNKGNYQISPWVHSAAGEDPDNILPDFYTCTAGRNFSGVCDANFDQMVQRQSEMTDMAERVRQVNAMDLAMLAQLNRAMIMWQKKFMAVSARVRNLVIHPVMDNNRRLQDVWLST